MEKLKSKLKYIAVHTMAITAIAYGINKLHEHYDLPSKEVGIVKDVIVYETLRYSEEIYGQIIENKIIMAKIARAINSYNEGFQEQIFRRTPQEQEALSQESMVDLRQRILNHYKNKANIDPNQPELGLGNKITINLIEMEKTYESDVPGPLQKVWNYFRKIHGHDAGD